MSATEATPGRVVLVGPLPPPYGGVSTFLERLSLAVPSIVRVVLDTAGEPLDPGHRGRDASVEVYRLPNGAVRLWMAIWKRLRGLSPDIHVILNVSHPQGVLRYLPAACSPASTAVVLHHGTPSERPGVVGSLVDWLTGLFLRGAVEVVVCLNESQALFVRRRYGVPASSIRFASSYVPVDMVLPDRSPPERRTGRIRVVASGEPREYHHFEELIDVWGAGEFGETAELTICLYGPANRPLESAIAEAAREAEEVRLLRDLDGWEFLSVLRESDVYVRASSVDAFGIAVADAVRLGLEVIATDVCDRYPGCRLVPPEDWDALRGALRTAIESRQEARERGTRRESALPGAHQISLLEALDIDYQHLVATGDEEGR